MDRSLRVLVRCRRRFIIGERVAEPGDVVAVRAQDLRALLGAGLAELVRDVRDEVDPMTIVGRVG